MSNNDEIDEINEKTKNVPSVDIENEDAQFQIKNKNGEWVTQEVIENIDSSTALEKFILWSKNYDPETHVRGIIQKKNDDGEITNIMSNRPHDPDDEI